MKTIAAIIAGLALAATLLAAPSAHAEDQRPCVSVRESHGLHRDSSGHLPTRAEVEKAWDVTGLGRPTWIPVFEDVIAYPRCGFGFNTLDPMQGKGFTAIWYDRKDRAQAVIWYRQPGSQAHGHPRLVR